MKETSALSFQYTEMKGKNSPRAVGATDCQYVHQVSKSVCEFSTLDLKRKLLTIEKQSGIFKWKLRRKFLKLKIVFSVFWAVIEAIQSNVCKVHLSAGLIQRPKRSITENPLRAPS